MSEVRREWFLSECINNRNCRPIVGGRCRVETRDDALVEEVKREKARRKAHLGDDRSTAPTPYRTRGELGYA